MSGLDLVSVYVNSPLSTLQNIYIYISIIIDLVPAIKLLASLHVCTILELINLCLNETFVPFFSAHRRIELLLVTTPSSRNLYTVC